jgi:hypothetical protein
MLSLQSAAGGSAPALSLIVVAATIVLIVARELVDELPGERWRPLARGLSAAVVPAALLFGAVVWSRLAALLS